MGRSNYSTNHLCLCLAAQPAKRRTIWQGRYSASVVHPVCWEDRPFQGANLICLAMRAFMTIPLDQCGDVGVRVRGQGGRVVPSDNPYVRALFPTINTLFQIKGNYFASGRFAALPQNGVSGWCRLMKINRLRVLGAAPQLKKTGGKKARWSVG